MTERVDFYILTGEAAAERWKFACRLAEKAYLRDLRVVIVNDTTADARALDDLLWTFNDSSFIPHNVCMDEDSKDPSAPVQLAVPPGTLPPADLLVNLSGRVPETWERYARIAEIIDADEERRRLGRERFKYYRDLKVVLEAHQHATWSA
jgi:DNA polymerase-3 subunit chi